MQLSASFVQVTLLSSYTLISNSVDVPSEILPNTCTHGVWTDGGGAASVVDMIFGDWRWFWTTLCSPNRRELDKLRLTGEDISCRIGNCV